MAFVMDGMLEDLLNERQGGSLGGILRQLKLETGLPLKDLTVLSTQNDPFRLDTQTSHSVGQWFRDQMQRAGLLDRENPIHNRGVHYAVVSQGKVKRPNGKPYKNDDEGWSFLEQASKCARWLGYVPFERITDERNTAPVIRVADLQELSAGIATPEAYDLPDFEDLRPNVDLGGFEVRQPYRIAIYGEKTSLQDVLRPLSVRYDTDLYLPSGEISDTFLHIMAKTGARDGREMVVLVLADCDPSGYQMFVSIAHKLRAFQEMLYPNLRFRCIPVALTVEQVKELNLPSSPLKPTELRATGWLQRYGVEQTEIDALATLRPQVLKDIVVDAIAPYYDVTLEIRVDDARYEWMKKANASLEDAINNSPMGSYLGSVENSLSELQAHMQEVRRLAETLYVPLPHIILPEPELDEPPKALISSDMDLLEAIRVLRSRKDYGGNAA